MKIGLVDIDTSHPGAWTPIIREMGHEVTAVWDGGTVRSEAYVRKFAEENEVDISRSLEELADSVDCAVIHSCNWDLHVPRARVFLERGKSVLLDKPLAGNVRDIRQIVRWAEEGHRIFGGSSMRFTYEARDFLAEPEEERGRPLIAVAGCAVDDFNYGIHAYAALWSIFGPGAGTVRYLGECGQKQVEVVWRDGRRGILNIGKLENWLPFYALVVTGKAVRSLAIDNSRIYRALLESSLPYLAGEIGEPPIPMAELVEPELAAIAMLKSLQEGGRSVRIDELSEDDCAYDGAAFGLEYRRASGG